MAVLATSCYVELPIRHLNPNTPSSPTPHSPQPSTPIRPTSTPPPTFIYTQPAEGPISFPPQQQSLPPPPISSIKNHEDQEMMEGALSFRQAQLLAKTRIRKLDCSWRGCDAELASIDTLQKHLEHHVSVMHASNFKHGSMQVDNDTNDIIDDDLINSITRDLGLSTAPRIDCHWDKCLQHDFADYDTLRQHITVKHINKLVNDHCPHKDCEKRAMSEQIHIHAERRNPGPWSKDDIKQQRIAPQKPVLDKPLVPFSRLPPFLPPYMVTSPLFAPTRKPPIPIPSPSATIPPNRSGPSRVIRLRVTSASSSSSSSRREDLHPIVQIRDPDDFWPMHGEAECQTTAHAFTSSIFPRPNPFRYDEVKKRWRKVQMKGRYDPQSTMTVSKKTKLPRRPLLFVGADIWAEHRREELEREKMETYDRIRAMGDEQIIKPEPNTSISDSGSDPKGKRKATDDLASETNKKFSLDSINRITRASANRATRLTGRSIGIARFEEMIPFERRGIELGYLPPDFSLAK